MLKMIEDVREILHTKWRMYAYRDVMLDGQLFYFVISSSANDWVVMPAWGTSVIDARVRLESSLRLLGASGKLMEFESGPIDGRLQLPYCQPCGAVMRPDGHLLGGWIQLWRCGLSACRRRTWSMAGKILPPPRVTLYGRNSPYDIDA